MGQELVSGNAELLRDIDDPGSPAPQPLKFPWEEGRIGPGRDANTNAGPHFMLDGKQFEQGGVQHIDQRIPINATRDWVIENTTVTNPFHIYVDPFQAHSCQQRGDVFGLQSSAPRSGRM